jgi:hypothetical protein
MGSSSVQLDMKRQRAACLELWNRAHPGVSAECALARPGTKLRIAGDVSRSRLSVSDCTAIVFSGRTTLDRWRRDSLPAFQRVTGVLLEQPSDQLAPRADIPAAVGELVREIVEIAVNAVRQCVRRGL